jgi:hypothetical protein
MLRLGVALASAATNLKVIDTYTKLALRAQNQRRSNIEALATINRPALRQTNIANGSQQVNNRVIRDGVEIGDD